MIRLKNYYSWSQHYLWKTSKREYYKRYCLGEESKPNKFFNKGKELGSYMQMLNENEGNIDPRVLAESISADPLLCQVGKTVPTLDIMEDKLEVVVGEDKHNLLGFVDSVNIENTEFLEYKTGKVDPKGNDPWDQDRVNDHDQLKKYALMYWIKSGRKSIPKCNLVWIETEIVIIKDEIGNPSHEELRYTGRVEVFERNFIVSELVDFEKEIISAIEEINEYEYVEMDVENDIVLRYAYLNQTIKEMKNEMEAIKEGLLVEMQLDEVKYASSESGRFTISERKTWDYSDSLTASILESKDFFDKAKKLEQKDGSASYSTKASLLFKEI